MNQPRSCWNVLLNKAQEEVQRIQGEMQQLRERLQSLGASRERLMQLYQDYLRPPAEGTVSAGMQETMNRRQFAAQLLTLVERVDQDKAQVEQALAHTRQRLMEAERERLKMQSLLDNDLRQVQASARKREQRQLDEIGTMQFNLGGGA